jgi:uncharacterized protein
MSKIESYAPGYFCWAELASSDTAAAKQFYSDLFGWTAVDMPMPEGVYTLFKAGGEDVAAVCAAQPGHPTNWGIYFSVASADDAAARVTEAGGKILAGPFDAHDAGRMAIAQDPTGTTFSLWQARRSIGATYAGDMGKVVWPELATPDPAAAVAFYTHLFGWTSKPDTGIADAPYIEWNHNGKAIGGLLPMRGEEWKGIPPHWLIYITVADCEERAARAKAIGGNLRVPPCDIPNVGRFSIVNDPQGGTFAIIQMTAAAHSAGA